MARVGLVVNPEAGRDIRRLTGGASVVDNHAKRRVAACLLDGLTAVPDPPAVSILPDRAGIAANVVEDAPDGVAVDRLDITVEGSAADTRRAAARFRETADVIVVLGGDGTTRDAAMESGDIPLLAVSTGTNNVVPTPVDGTIAGVAAAVVATERVDADAVTRRHGTVEARAETPTSEKRVTGLASVEVSDRSFVGTRALIDPADLVGGVVSRAHPTEIGLSGVAGCLDPFDPGTGGGAALHLCDPGEADRSVRTVVAPGVTATVGVERHRRLDADDPARFDVPDGVVGADGERELELVDATVEIAPREEGPRLVDVRAALDRAARAGVFSPDTTR
ncbi:NAD(+)/NADH kinase [Haloplanus aerogenes]|uniref:ATP-NAD kinase n=1 Tax=Haloplanus aerogenes TaxID=660522 RepID=A0A3M0DCA9_9EURY|nr:NAD(+)/NADH kinase [Haloplanus aerogenes]AZH26385.1 ATP-NAD kinase [Haloplanus aerogenes]RMB18150.1 ATP-NAD kinase [Haloplanus aerogenes]